MDLKSKMKNYKTFGKKPEDKIFGSRASQSSQISHQNDDPYTEKWINWTSLK